MARAESGSALDALSQTELTALTLCEARIEQGKAAFLEVGNALARIREEKLYRGTHGTFEAYCQDRWSFSRQHASLLCRAAEVVENLKLSTVVDIPETERQARPLTKLPKAEQSQAWADAVASAPDGKPTAKHVEKIVQERLSTTDYRGSFTCPNCGGHQLSEHNDCERCKEPIDVPAKSKAPAFDFDRACYKTADLLEKIDTIWPAEKKRAMCQQITNFVNQTIRSLKDA